MSELRQLLDRYRATAQTEREKGDYFEALVLDFFKNDPTYSAQYDAIWKFADWAEQQGHPKNDTGIDLVARIAEDQSFCALQCKFYDANHRIQKSDIDSFFTASGKSWFARRIIADTTEGDWGKNAIEALAGQSIAALRLGLDQLEQSPIDWSQYGQDRTIRFDQKKALRPHQTAALEKVREGLIESTDTHRGKLIMACGTGKTFTSLRMAEQLVGVGKSVLYLVPSLALMSQTIRAWHNDTETPLRAFSACSDSMVGKRKESHDDTAFTFHDLAQPATTDAKKLAAQIAAHPDPERMLVVFSTYQSIGVISDAQNKHGLPEFDLIICDEAHRTTGATIAGADESNFVKVHDQSHIKGKKRLYMTATPRVFGEGVKSKAKEHAAEWCSMDDEAKYGPTLHTVTFAYAVENDLLTDYKVIVLAMDEQLVSDGVQKRLMDDDSQLVLDDATKIIGCYRALNKQGVQADLSHDPTPMRSAVAFCRDIDTSKLVVKEFAAVVEAFQEEQGEDKGQTVQTAHVDGGMNAKQRQSKLDWLTGAEDPDVCRILSNARCLSEGIDVPSLDAILFLHPRKSQIDVVQSVGRVMRRAQGKKLGYVILPVGIPAGLSPEEALNDNEKYKVVWQILNALRAHDERLDADINKGGLGEDISNRIEVIAEVKDLRTPDAKAERSGLGEGGSGNHDNANDSVTISAPLPTQGAFSFDAFQQAIMAKIVKKCGNRDFWEDWAKDIADIAKRHIARITTAVSQDGSQEQLAFQAFLLELRDDLNQAITEADAIEMLAQHMITKPVFDALFEGQGFTEHNTVSQALQKVLVALDTHNIDREAEALDKFYASVKRRAQGIETGQAKQKLIVELYEKFFKGAFKKLTDRLGIVYTPVEVVDFIIHSVNDILQQEFGQTIGSPGVHIMDPFTGTGTFITRLLQSGLIKPEELKHKYQNELHANEIVLLAYYIAAINIEQTYHDVSGGDRLPFDGICLTDTFQLYEKDDMIKELLADNSHRRIRQKELDIRVIMGNPPYSGGQGSANDNAANIKYPQLDENIRQTYAAHSEAHNLNGLYDSYIRAIRWASDRIGDRGVIGFITGSAWVERQFADGMRQCLADEMTNIYVIHLRGDVRKNMLSKGRAREGGNIFEQGSMTGNAISLLVKNPDAPAHGHIILWILAMTSAVRKRRAS